MTVPLGEDLIHARFGKVSQKGQRKAQIIMAGPGREMMMMMDETVSLSTKVSIFNVTTTVLLCRNTHAAPGES